MYSKLTVFLLFRSLEIKILQSNDSNKNSLVSIERVNLKFSQKLSNFHLTNFIFREKTHIWLVALAEVRIYYGGYRRNQFVSICDKINFGKFWNLEFFKKFSFLSKSNFENLISETGRNWIETILSKMTLDRRSSWLRSSRKIWLIKYDSWENITNVTFSMSQESLTKTWLLNSDSVWNLVQNG